MYYNRFFTLFYWIFHGGFTVCELLWRRIGRLRVLSHELFSNKRNVNTNYVEIIKNLVKTPEHLTVLLGGETPSYPDLANLILWCLTARITHVSFYDYTGVLNLEQDKLVAEVSRRKQQDDHVIWWREKHKNGFLGRKVHVKVLGEEDGRLSLVNVCQNAQFKDYTVQEVNEELSKLYQFPDPELGLICGQHMNLYNYPPWQIRVTEFLDIKTHHQITFDLFLNCLLRYNKCEQRLGK